jgi:DNA-directed RNA polymerase subunit L
MLPSLSNIKESNSIYQFTLHPAPKSVANALRRTILEKIPSVVLDIGTAYDDKCKIYENTGRLTNEILKHRLSGVPVYAHNLKRLGDAELVLDVENTGDETMIVTTEHFKIRQKGSGASGSDFWDESEVRKIFPKDPITQCYIDLLRLQAPYGATIPGEKIHLVCGFTTKTGADNSMYTAVSKCSYGQTIDHAKVDKKLEELRDKWASEGLAKDEIAFRAKNFELLDAQRITVADSYDFVIQSIGVYDNKSIVRIACDVLQKRLGEMVEDLDADMVPIKETQASTIENCYDVTLVGEDYTYGPLIQQYLFNKYYTEDKLLTFCGFSKFHPHDSDSTLRIAYKDKTDKGLIKTHLRVAMMDARAQFTYAEWKIVK